MSGQHSGLGASESSLVSLETDDPRKKNRKERRKKHSDSKVTRDILKIANRISSKLEECSASDSSLLIDLDRIGVCDTQSPQRIKLHHAREQERVNCDKIHKLDMRPHSDLEPSDMEQSPSILETKREKSKSPRKIMSYLQSLNSADTSPSVSKKAKRKSQEKQLDIESQIGKGPDKLASKKKRKSKDKSESDQQEEIISTKMMKREATSQDDGAGEDAMFDNIHDISDPSQTPMESDVNTHERCVQ